MIDPSLLVRAARRRTGLSQRDFAALSGIAPRALAAAEAGDHHPSWRTLARAAEAAGLSLDLVPAVDEPSEDLQRFLAMSTADRLLAGFGRQHRVVADLSRLTHTAAVHLTGPAAVPVWVPGALVPVPVPVRVHGRRRSAPPSAHLAEQDVSGELPRPLVPVRLRGARLLFVDDPSALSLREDCADQAQALRAAERCLHDGQPADRAGRRRPAHRDPDEQGEASYLVHVKGFRPYALPDARDSRAWRVGGSVSLAQWMAQGRPERG